MPVTELNPLSDDKGPLVTFRPTCTEINLVVVVGGGGGCTNGCMHVHSLVHTVNTQAALLLLKVINKAIKLILTL